MEKNIFNSNHKLYSNNNNILIEIVNDLQQLMNNSKDNLIIQALGGIINKMNYIIKENQKNLELIRKEISTSYNKLNNKIDKLKINQEIDFKDGKYTGETINGKAEGKGIKYYKNGDKYEGDWKNGIKEGKGIYYYKNGGRYEGDWKNSLGEGKGIHYYKNGDIYEGGYKNGLKEGKGIIYYNNGDRRMGDYSKDKPIGMHVILTQDGEVKTKNFN